MKAYAVELAPSAVRTYKKLPTDLKRRLRAGLDKLGRQAAEPGRIGGKSTKTLRGVADSFHRLRVGDYRAMYDVLDEERVILVLGIVHRGELEGWLRGR